MILLCPLWSSNSKTMVLCITVGLEGNNCYVALHLDQATMKMLIRFCDNTVRDGEFSNIFFKVSTRVDSTFMLIYTSHASAFFICIQMFSHNSCPLIWHKKKKKKPDPVFSQSGEGNINIFFFLAWSFNSTYQMILTLCPLWSFNRKSMVFRGLFHSLSDAQDFLFIPSLRSLLL